MKRMILLAVMTMLATGAVFAHGKEQHIMGTVTAIAGDSITVQTIAKDQVTIYIMPDTKYEKSGAAASIKDLKIGDHVVIHAMIMEQKLMATEVRFGAMAKMPPHQ